MKPRYLALLVLLTLAIMLFSLACGGNTTTPTTSTTQPPTTTTTTQPPTTTTTEPPTTTTTQPPTTTTTEPPTTTTTEPPTTSSGADVLTKAALPLTGANHSSGTAAMCMLCHGPGVGAQQYPVAPEWAGTTLTPGPWTVTPGSDADHTGRTDTAACIQSGCHAAPWATPTTTPPPSTTTTAPPTTTTEQPPSTEAQSGTITVKVAASGFTPTTVTITAGSTILWQNDEHEDIAITSDDGKIEAEIPAGDSYEQPFDTPGTYTYYNAENPSARGTIIVV